MLGLFYPYGFILQAVAILHFVRRRPDNYWLFIILMGGAIGALVYIVVEVIPDAGLLGGAFQVFPRRKRIKELEMATSTIPPSATMKSSDICISTKGSSSGRAAVSIG